MHNDAVVQGLSEVPFMQDVKHWGVLTIGTGLGNARFTNRAAGNGKEVRESAARLFPPPRSTMTAPAPRGFDLRLPLWRGGRVVECTALEMRHTGNRIGGSNPPLSATDHAGRQPGRRQACSVFRTADPDCYFYTH